jgi:hypothetical protein
MTIDHALEKLREHWHGHLYVDEQPSVVTVSNRSRAARETAPPPGVPMPRVYEAPSLAIALTMAIHAEGLDR